MRLFAVLASMQLLAGSMALATGDPSAVEIGNASAIEIRNSSTIEIGNASALETRSLDAHEGHNWPQGPWCGQMKGLLVHGWVARLPGFENPKEVRDTCHRLWGGLRGYVACVVSSPHGCDMDPYNATIMHWHFHTSIFCKPHMVEQTIHSATNGRYGDLKCVEHNP